MKLEERIGVKFPDGGHHIVIVQVDALDDDEKILKRFGAQVGTVFSIAGGNRYKVVSQDPFKLERITGMEETMPKLVPSVGETWKPRDVRRKTAFKVVDVTPNTVWTDDGRSIQLVRFGRYERVLAD